MLLYTNSGWQREGVYMNTIHEGLQYIFSLFCGPSVIAEGRKILYADLLEMRWWIMLSMSYVFNFDIEKVLQCS